MTRAGTERLALDKKSSFGCFFAAYEFIEIRDQCVDQQGMLSRPLLSLISAGASGATTPPPSSPALLPEGEGGKLPLPPGEGWGEGKRLILRGFATDIEVATEELRLNGNAESPSIQAGGAMPAVYLVRDM